MHTNNTKRRTTSAKRRSKRGLVYRDRVTGRFVSKSIRKRPRVLDSSRYKRESRYSANLNVLGSDGYVSVSVRSSKQAHLASEHLIAVGKFIGQIPSGQAGDTELLKPFIGKSVGGVELLTDPNRLRELAEAGLIKLDALYRQNRAGRHAK